MADDMPISTPSRGRSSHVKPGATTVASSTDKPNDSS